MKDKPIRVNLYVVNFILVTENFKISDLHSLSRYLFLLCLVCFMLKVYYSPNANKNQISIRLVLLCVVINQLTRVTYVGARAVARGQ